MQLSLIINDDTSLKNLNNHLEGGWLVINSCPMPSSRSSNGSINYDTPPTCLVIIDNGLVIEE